MLRIFAYSGADSRAVSFAIWYLGEGSHILETIAITQRAILNLVLKKNQRFPSVLNSEFPVMNIRQLFIKTLFVHIQLNKNTPFPEIQHQHPTRKSFILVM